MTGPCTANGNKSASGNLTGSCVKHEAVIPVAAVSGSYVVLSPFQMSA